MDETLESPCHQKEVFDLASLLANPRRRIDPVTWKEICPGLSLTSAVHKNDVQNGKIEVTPNTQIKVKRRQEKLTHDGYALVDDSLDVKLIREGIEALHHRKLPATFILMFDETWKLALESKRILEKSSHKKNIFNYDLLAWYIPPGSAGFSPHRDRQPDDASTTFHSDNQPKFITQWIALSDATPENSCLYVIPKPYDPGYITGDITEESTTLLLLLLVSMTILYIEPYQQRNPSSIYDAFPGKLVSRFSLHIALFIGAHKVMMWNKAVIIVTMIPARQSHRELQFHLFVPILISNLLYWLITQNTSPIPRTVKLMIHL